MESDNLKYTIKGGTLMVFDKTGEARSAMEKGAPVSHRVVEKRYVGRIDAERKSDGKFHFKGTLEGGTEEISSWLEPHRLSVIE